MKRYYLIACFSIAAGCGDFPVFDREDYRSSIATTPPPRILPIEGLLVRALGPARAVGAETQPIAEFTDPMQARIARLKQRAAILRGSPVDATTRGRLARQ